MIRTPTYALLLALAVPALAPAQEPAPPPEAPKPETKPDAKPKAKPPVPAPEDPAVDAAARAIDEVRDRLGIEFAIVTSKLRRRAIRTATPYGFAIAKVAPDSLAAKAGLDAGEIVLYVDGQPLREVAELAAVLRAKKPGEVVKLAGSRRKQPRQLLDRHPWENFAVDVRLPDPRDGAPKEQPKEQPKKDEPGHGERRRA